MRFEIEIEEQITRRNSYFVERKTREKEKCF